MDPQTTFERVRDYVASIAPCRRRGRGRPSSTTACGAGRPSITRDQAAAACLEDVFGERAVLPVRGWLDPRRERRFAACSACRSCCSASPSPTTRPTRRTSHAPRQLRGRPADDRALLAEAGATADCTLGLGSRSAGPSAAGRSGTSTGAVVRAWRHNLATCPAAGQPSERAAPPNGAPVPRIADPARNDSLRRRVACDPVPPAGRHRSRLTAHQGRLRPSSRSADEVTASNGASKAPMGQQTGRQANGFVASPAQRRRGAQRPVGQGQQGRGHRVPADPARASTPLDRTLGGGIRAGELMLIGGAQGTGKTTMSLQIARNIAQSGQANVLYICFEHDEEYLLNRMMAMESALAGHHAARAQHRGQDPGRAPRGARHVDGAGRPTTKPPICAPIRACARRSSASTATARACSCCAARTRHTTAAEPARAGRGLPRERADTDRWSSSSTTCSASRSSPIRRRKPRR